MECMTHKYEGDAMKRCFPSHLKDAFGLLCTFDLIPRLHSQLASLSLTAHTACGQRLQRGMCRSWNCSRSVSSGPSWRARSEREQWGQGARRGVATGITQRPYPFSTPQDIGGKRGMCWAGTISKRPNLLKVKCLGSCFLEKSSNLTFMEYLPCTVHWSPCQALHIYTHTSSR